MKDALGHGSNPSGSHSAGVEAIGKPTNVVTDLTGRRFRKEVVSPTYSRYVPVDDPNWMLKFLHSLHGAA
jgi:hypothetical protein